MKAIYQLLFCFYKKNIIFYNFRPKVLLELFNANGRLLISKTFSLDVNLRDINLDTSGLPQGSYILKVNGQTVSDSKLIIKE